MFIRKSPREDRGLKTAIDSLLIAMKTVTPDSEEYSTMVDQLTKLYSLKEIDAPRRVSPDTLAIVAGNIVGIVLIVGHEKAHVVTSKALNFVLKAR